MVNRPVRRSCRKLLAKQYFDIRLIIDHECGVNPRGCSCTQAVPRIPFAATPSAPERFVGKASEIVIGPCRTRGHYKPTRHPWSGRQVSVGAELTAGCELETGSWDNRPTVEPISDVRRGALPSFQSFEIGNGVPTICGVRNGEEHP